MARMLRMGIGGHPSLAGVGPLQPRERTSRDLRPGLDTGHVWTHAPRQAASSFNLRRRAASSEWQCRSLCLSKIKSEHIRGAIRRGLGGKECALPSSRCAIGGASLSKAAGLIVVARVRSQNAAQMHLAQDNDVVQTLPAD